jgi:hypothetical protein
MVFLGEKMDREELYHKWGPILLDAITQVMLSEINILREEAGLLPRSGQQLIDAVANKLETIPEYDWMGGYNGINPNN